MIQFLIKVCFLKKGLCYNKTERDRLGIRGLIPGVERTIE